MLWMGGGGGAVLVLGFLLDGLLGPFDPDAPCVFGDLAALDIVSVVVFWVEVVLIEAFIEIEGFWPLGANGP